MATTGVRRVDLDAPTSTSAPQPRVVRREGRGPVSAGAEVARRASAAGGAVATSHQFCTRCTTPGACNVYTSSATSTDAATDGSKCAGVSLAGAAGGHQPNERDSRPPRRHERDSRAAQRVPDLRRTTPSEAPLAANLAATRPARGERVARSPNLPGPTRHSRNPDGPDPVSERRVRPAWSAERAARTAEPGARSGCARASPDGGRSAGHPAQQRRQVRLPGLAHHRALVHVGQVAAFDDAVEPV